ncbi:MAG: 2TM domain-containing protein [Candidatus Pacearchaeota archaeon]|nr:2TM domain-containing protein [Candidatus Pacearchaeota archaeon]
MKRDYNKEENQVMKMKNNDKNLSFFERLKKKIIRKANRAMIGFSAHAIVYGAVNVLVFILYLLLTPFVHPWFYYLLGGWGIGLLSHYQYIRNTKKDKEQILPIKDLNPEQIAALRRLQKSDSAFRQHRTAFVSVIGYLFGINMITYSKFLWFVFPALAWGVGLTAHWAVYRAKKKYLAEELTDAGLSWTDIKKHKGTQYTGHTATSEYKEKFIEAVQIKNDLLQQLEADRELQLHFGGELETLLNTFIKQIDELIQRDSGLNKVLTKVSEEEVEKALISLKVKLNQTDDSYLKAEYEKTINQYVKQKASITELKNAKEVIYLRVTSSYTLLKQMQLDVARMKNIATVGEPPSLTQLREKSSEISLYLEDLKQSYIELEAKE